MIFERKTLENFDKIYILVTMFAIIVAVVVTYGICVVLGVFYPDKINSNFSFFDVISVISQVATALTFVFVLIQYRKQIIQQRQKIISDEAINQIEKMVVVIEEIKCGEKSSLENVALSIDKLFNISVGFDELFRAMNEDVQKAIVRIRWQDMLFNNFMPKMTGIDLIHFLKNEFKYDEKFFDEKISKFNIDFSGVEILKKFYLYESLLKSIGANDKNIINKEIDDVGVLLDIFTKNDDLNDLLHGLMSRVDSRVCAPFLSAVRTIQNY